MLKRELATRSAFNQGDADALQDAMAGRERAAQDARDATAAADDFRAKLALAEEEIARCVPS